MARAEAVSVEALVVVVVAMVTPAVVVPASGNEGGDGLMDGDGARAEEKRAQKASARTRLEAGCMRSLECCRIRARSV